jgi:hypothetical protein
MRRRTVVSLMDGTLDKRNFIFVFNMRCTVTNISVSLQLASCMFGFYNWMFHVEEGGGLLV